MQKTKIDFGIGPMMTWNPLIGCKHGCTYYCYAKRLNDRFKWIPEWTEPKFFQERLDEPFRIKKPAKIFVCSMSDLFGDWVLREDLMSIFRVIGGNQRHQFYLLTKNPGRMSNYLFPDNCWCGVTVEEKRNMDRFYKLKAVDSRHKFLSIEPLLNDMNYDFTEESLDFIIVGADTSPGRIKPKLEWISELRHLNIHWKKSARSLEIAWKEAND